MDGGRVSYFAISGGPRVAEPRRDGDRRLVLH